MNVTVIVLITIVIVALVALFMMKKKHESYMQYTHMPINTVNYGAFRDMRSDHQDPAHVQPYLH